MPDGRCLLLFTKPPHPGRVKTRLIGDLTPGQAAELHAALVGDLLERLAGGGFELRIAWALEPGESVPAGPLPGLRQEGADLGERLYGALARAGRSRPLVAAVGSDHPLLSRARVEEAFDLLEAGAEVVLGPAADGGYYLIAVRADRLDPHLFRGIPWSTGEVLATTRSRCGELGLRLALLDEQWDVDTPEDLSRLADELAREAASCPRTRRLLGSWGRLEA